MYLAHFGLTKKPFEISPDPHFLWLGEKHREGLSILKYGILENKGFLLITGEVGTGKTALIRAIERDIQARAIVVTIPDPGMSLMDFYNFLAAELKMQRHFRNKGEFLIQFKKFILNAFSSSTRVLLIIDESQRLNHELLEEIRLLSNIDLDGRVQLNIFFVGQNEFRKIITREENRAVRQRITVSYHLSPLTEDETVHYIRHRLKVAGASQDIFTPEALKTVHGFSKGLPRLTNIVCDNALMTAYVRNLEVVDADIVRECGDDLRITIGVEAPLEKEKPPLSASTAKKIEKPPVPAQVDHSHSARGVVIFLSFLSLLVAGWYFYGDLISDQLAHWGNRMGTRQSQGSATNESSGHLSTAPPLPVETGPRQPPPTDAPADTTKSATAAAPPPTPAALPKPQAPEPQAAPEPAQSEPSPMPPPEPVAPKPAAPPVASAPTPAPPPAPATPAAEPFKLKDFTVFFGQNSAELNAQSIEILTKVAGLIKAAPGTVVTLEGHSDSVGDAGYNRLISENRAVSVKNYLISRGIESARITASGFGSDKPIDTNETLEGRSKNRRVMIRIIPSKQG